MKYTHLRLSLNKGGRDYIISDLHGCYKEFQKKLVEIGFNKKTDRMFSVGDLNDRGEDSVSCLNLIKEPWFYSVLGNHETMLLDAYYQKGNYYTKYNNSRNGGDWFYEISDETQKELVDLIETLPLSITIGKNKIGICHAEPPSNDWEDRFNDEFAATKLLWGRDWIKNESTIVNNIEHTYHGHTPVKEPITIGNSTFIDTGAVFKGGKLTCLELNYD